MPPLTSTHPDTKKSDEWVVVASFHGFDADLEADCCVADLKGHRIPAMRVPTNTVASLAGLGLTMTQAVRVLVPPDREEDAKELLAEGQE